MLVLVMGLALALPAPPVLASMPIARSTPSSPGANVVTFPAAVAPPTGVRASDRPNDNGGAVILEWRLSADDRPRHGLVTGYEILRAPAEAGPYRLLTRVDAGNSRYVDIFAGKGKAFFYQVVALAGTTRGPAGPVGPVVSTAQWFNRRRLNMLTFTVLLAAAILFGIHSARGGKLPRLRELPGVGAVERAIDLARDRNRPVLFITGSEDLNDIQTLAGLSVLKEVAGRAASAEVTLRVPHMHSLVMTAAGDTLEEGRAAGGRPAPADPDENFYLCDEQFGLVAGAGGIMFRERPAACLYFGSFYAEALALGEIGQTVGAVQVAGTGQTSQLPFLLTTCDHVLVGEELFAASALLSRDPAQLGCVRGQDLVKLLAVGLIGLGCLVATLAQVTGWGPLVPVRETLRSLFGTG